MTTAVIHAEGFGKRYNRGPRTRRRAESALRRQLLRRGRFLRNHRASSEAARRALRVASRNAAGRQTFSYHAQLCEFHGPVRPLRAGSPSRTPGRSAFRPPPVVSPGSPLAAQGRMENPAHRRHGVSVSIWPGHNPVRWHSLESSPALRRLFSPFAYTYFLMAEKPEK